MDPVEQIREQVIDLRHRVTHVEQEVKEMQSYGPRLTHIEQLLLQVRAVIVVAVLVLVVLKGGIPDLLKMLW